jgi:hypothetical protein
MFSEIGSEKLPETFPKKSSDATTPELKKDKRNKIVKKKTIQIEQMHLLS